MTVRNSRSNLPQSKDFLLRSVARPKQARSERTLARLLEAAEALIAEKGLADASVPEIVRRAGSSVGGFYARFRDKNELLRALEERFFNELTERVENLLASQAAAQDGVPRIVRRCVEELVAVAAEKAALLQAFLFRASGDSEFRADGLRFRREVARKVGALLLPRRAEIGHPAPEIGIDLAVQLAFGFITQMVVFGEVRAGGRVLSAEELVDELTRAFTGYLSIPETV